MPSRYITKTGEVHHYPQDPNRDHGGGGGPGPNLTLRIDEALMPNIIELAAALGHVRLRGVRTGEGSISAFLTAIGQAVQREGVEAVAQRLCFVAKPPAARPSRE